MALEPGTLLLQCGVIIRERRQDIPDTENKEINMTQSHLRTDMISNVNRRNCTKMILEFYHYYQWLFYHIRHPDENWRQ
jgi:hypothetical protein